MLSDNRRKNRAFAICIFRMGLGVAMPSLPDYLSQVCFAFVFSAGAGLACVRWGSSPGSGPPAFIYCNHHRTKHYTERVVAA